MSDLSAEAVQATADALHEAGCSEPACHYAMHVNAPTDGDRRIAEIVLEAAAPYVAEAERAKLQPAIDRVASLAEAAQEKAVAVAVAAERERLVGVLWKLCDFTRPGMEYPVEAVPWSSVLSALGSPVLADADPIAEAVSAERERLTAMAEKVDAHSWYDDDGSGIAVKVPFADVIRKDAAP